MNSVPLEDADRAWLENAAAYAGFTSEQIDGGIREFLLERRRMRYDSYSAAMALRSYLRLPVE